MLKKEITYDDPFGEGQITKTFYFNLTKAEITEWEYSINGGLKTYLESIVENPEGNENAIMSTMKEIILRSYGERDGQDFVKSDDIRQRFQTSEAYSQLFWELCTQANAAAEFINAIVPRELNSGQEQLPVDDLKERMAQKLGTKEPDAPNFPRELSRTEAAEMDSDELQSGLVTGRYKLAQTIE